MKNKKVKMPFNIFFTVVICIGILVSVSAFAVIFSQFVSGTGNAPSSTTPPQTAEPTATKVPGKIETITAMLKVVSDKYLELFDIERGRTYTLFSDNTTDFKDKYGGAMFLAEFTEGDIVEAQFNSETSVLQMMRISADSFVKKGITGSKVDAEEGKISINNEKYTFRYGLICKYKDSDLDVSLIDAVDVANFKGYRDTVWFAQVTQGHGTVKIEARNEIVNAVLEIDNNFYRNITENMEILLAEGAHRALVKGGNMDMFQAEFFLEHGQAYKLDLESIPLNAGKLTVNVTPSNASVTLNDSKIKTGEPISIPFAIYTIKAERDGYEPFEEEFTFNEPIVTHGIVLKEIPATPSPSPSPTPSPSPVPTEKPTEAPVVRYGEVRIETDPSGAEAYIDGKYVGKTPVTISADYGLHTFSLKLEGYEPIAFSQTISESNYWPKVTLQPLDTVIKDEPMPGEEIIQ